MARHGNYFLFSVPTDSLWTKDWEVVPHCTAHKGTLPAPKGYNWLKITEDKAEIITWLAGWEQNGELVSLTQKHSLEG